MKNYYLLLFLIITLNFNAQTTNCDEANSYLVNAYSHVKDAYEANNTSHLKYYANRSVEAFKLSKKTLKDCGCNTALNLADKSIDLLAKVENTETYEDGRFFVKRARETAKESVIEIDKCSYSNNSDIAKSDENTELSNLQNEQLALKKQQEALKLKEEQIKNKLAQQKEKELTNKKAQLILSYENAIAANIKAYNHALKVCGYNHNQQKKTISPTDMSAKSMEAIKSYYIKSLKILASNYMEELNSCDK